MADDLVLDALGTAIRIRSSDQRLLDLIAELWAPLRVIDATEHDAVDLVAKRSAAGWVINGAEGSGIFGDPWSLVLALRTVIDALVEESAVGFVRLHATAVVRLRRVLLLPGLTGMGKTSLGVEMTSRGWESLCDDFAPIERSSGRVFPYHRPIGLRRGTSSFERLSARWTMPDWVPYMDRAPRLVPAALIPLARQPASVSHIAFPLYEDLASPSLRPLSSAEGLARFATFVTDLRSADLVLLKTLVRTARVAEIRFRDASWAADLVAAWFQNDSKSHTVAIEPK